MSGALLQLVAIGAQDALLIGDPEITFFQLVTRSHTNFAVESIDQTVNGTPGFGRTISCTVSRNGDLVSRVFVEAKLPKVEISTAGTHDKGFSWIHNIGHFLINEADVEIGGQRIDRHYGEWLHIWNELSGSSSHHAGYNRMIGNTPELLSRFAHAETGTTTSNTARTKIDAQTLLIPLQFWFCRSPGLALPLIALQYHEVKINITFNSMHKLLRVVKTAGDPAGVVTTDTEGTEDILETTDPGFWDTASAGDFKSVGDLEVKLWVDYVYLDNEERRRFATTAHNYLIDQLQTTGQEAIRGAHDRFRLNFNHPVKELVWVVQSERNPMGVYSYPSMGAIQRTQHNYSNKCTGVSQSDIDEVQYTGCNPVAKSKLILNGHDRFKERDSMYFDSVQPYQHHTNTPERPGINVFSFGLKPEEHQPSGTCNFSRIDNATLELTFSEYSNSNPSSDAYYKNANLMVYAVNYNQLRIISGMGGLTYSN